MSDNPQETWLPLLQQLTHNIPAWASWKNADAALNLSGDIDSVAPSADWERVIEIFSSWGKGRGFHMVFCRHLPGALIAVALDERARRVWELHIAGKQVFRGTVLFHAEELSPLETQDSRGFRRVVPGAEGLFLLALNGLRFPGRCNLSSLESKGVRNLLRVDPEGMLATTRFFGLAGYPLRKLALAVAKGGWSKRSAVLFEILRAARIIKAPLDLVRRLRFRFHDLGRCPVLRMTGGGRNFPPDLEPWLDEVAATGHHILLSGERT